MNILIIGMGPNAISIANHFTQIDANVSLVSNEEYKLFSNLSDLNDSYNLNLYEEFINHKEILDSKVNFIDGKVISIQKSKMSKISNLEDYSKRFLDTFKTFIKINKNDQNMIYENESDIVIDLSIPFETQFKINGNYYCLGMENISSDSILSLSEFLLENELLKNLSSQKILFSGENIFSTYLYQFLVNNKINQKISFIFNKNKEHYQKNKFINELLTQRDHIKNKKYEEYLLQKDEYYKLDDFVQAKKAKPVLAEDEFSFYFESKVHSITKFEDNDGIFIGIESNKEEKLQCIQVDSIINCQSFASPIDICSDLFLPCSKDSSFNELKDLLIYEKGFFRVEQPFLETINLNHMIKEIISYFKRV